MTRPLPTGPGRCLSCEANVPDRAADPLCRDCKDEWAAGAATTDPRPPRACYLPVISLWHLNQAAPAVEAAFDSTPYLVGSCLDRADFRDVDIRVLLEDDDFDRLFPGVDEEEADPLWSLVCATTSAWLGGLTGLPIDFQVQKRDLANARYPKRPRHPLGVLRSGIYASGGDRGVR
ncbi:hypothetical protein [Frankia sp. AgW1.1]|uniref:hypothetical protein n=1 Tax=Frankia sp. AgW1.1 TaxID=1836971 RepID=UPI00193338A6|nr:hypothetical protein [Frankia sp. AgW1.1]MBL7487133.1 hypothetical protein [Frankia sp. AgW1.1]